MIARLEVHRTQEGGVVDVGVVAEEEGQGVVASTARTPHLVPDPGPDPVPNPILG